MNSRLDKTREAFGNQSEQIWGGLELINVIPLEHPASTLYRHVQARIVDLTPRKTQNFQFLIKLPKNKTNTGNKSKDRISQSCLFSL